MRTTSIILTAPTGGRDARCAWLSPGSSPLLAALVVPGVASAATHTGSVSGI